jgi:hypothetical protein
MCTHEEAVYIETHVEDAGSVPVVTVEMAQITLVQTGDCTIGTSQTARIIRRKI